MDLLYGDVQDGCDIRFLINMAVLNETYTYCIVLS